uniref:carbohydrate sulfotransferase 14-like n=1 Tax=Styela clava TaxID=7725 RepID=UPI001939F499|nr:carbohydrate sulfotransferase 14-like [Styela clava]
MNFISKTKLYFSDKYKLLACLIPKVGCTNFKKVLLAAEGLVNSSDATEFKSSCVPTDKSSPVLSFKEFATHVSSTNDNNEHWQFFYKLCLPCAIKYDFIAKLETISDDIPFIMNTIGMSNMTFPQNYPPHKRTDDEKLETYFKDIPDVRGLLVEKYKYDFELFGYPLLF